jgi:hypothetical protein
MWLLAMGCGGAERRDEEPFAGLGVWGVSESSVWAGYQWYQPAPQPPCSTSLRIGDCFVPQTCSEPAATGGRSGTAFDDDVDPGEIRVAGLLIPRDDVGTGAFLLPSPPLPAGESVHFSVAGSAEVPRHEGDFVIPPLVRMTEPDLSQPVAVDRAQPLVFRWDPLEIGAVSVSVSVDEDPDGAIGCSVAASARELEIPPEVLSHLPDGGGGAQAASIGVRQEAIVQLYPGDWLVSVRTTGSGLSVPAEVK